MPDAVNICPFFRRLFAAADFVPDRRIKNFRAPTGQRAKPRLAHRPQLVFARWVVVERDGWLVFGFVQRVEHALRCLFDLLAALAAELDHQVRGAPR